MNSKEILKTITEISNFIIEYKNQFDEIEKSMFNEFDLCMDDGLSVFGDSKPHEKNTKQPEEVSKQEKRLIKTYSNIEECLNTLIELKRNQTNDTMLNELIEEFIEKIRGFLDYKSPYMSPNSKRGNALYVSVDPISQLSNELDNLAKQLEETVHALTVSSENPYGSLKMDYLENESNKIDKVKFIVATDKIVKQNEYCKIHIYGSTEKYISEIMQQISEEFENKFKKTTTSNVNVSHGQHITIKLASDDICIPPQETIYDFDWNGDYIKSTFEIFVPNDYNKGGIKFTAYIYVDGIQAQRITFSVNVAIETPPFIVEPINNKKAFVSYASKDREKVLLSVKAMQKAVPEMEFFVDVISLRCGEKWEERLCTEIPASDIFYLFWSNNARQSEWVYKELKCALNTKGIDFVEPMPLETPDIAPPPLELQEKHFNDVILNYIK